MKKIPETIECIEIYLNQEQKLLIQRAANLTGCSITNFVMSASQEAANKIVREHEIITLTTRESERFVDVLLNAPKPNTALKKASQRYQDWYVGKN